MNAVGEFQEYQNFSSDADYKGAFNTYKSSSREARTIEDYWYNRKSSVQRRVPLWALNPGWGIGQLLYNFIDDKVLHQNL